MKLLRDRYYLGAEETTVAGTVAVATIIAMLWQQASHTGLIIWAAMMAIALPLPVVLKRIQLPLSAWFRLLVPHELALALMWGSIALVAMPRTATWQAVLGAILGAIILGGSITSSQFLRAYLSFTGVFTLITTLGYVLHGVGEARIMIWILPLIWVFGLSMAHEQRQLQMELVLALQKNKKLVATLEDEHAKVVASNDSLADAAAKADVLARTDPLTQLANRYHFDEELDRQLEALEQGEARYLTMAFLDLDNFKYVNDSRGHRAGDVLLVAVARRLGKVIQPGELLARIGGDELVLISRAYDPFAVGKRLATAFEEPFVIERRDLPVSASIGVTTIAASVHRDEILRQADMAQYTAKRSGGNTFVVFDSDSVSSPPGWTP